MAEYKKITEVELIEEPSEGSTVLAEENGALKRVPYEKVGGGGGTETVWLDQSVTDGSITPSHTYAQVTTMLDANEFPTVVLRVNADGIVMVAAQHIQYLTSMKVLLVFISMYATIRVDWYPDGTLTYEQIANE